MLKMRLQRIGRRNDPSYRVLVVDVRQGPKSGKYVDLLGSYNPKLDRVQIDGEKAKDWIGKGVQVSGAVHNILVDQNIIKGKKVNVLPKKSPIVKEQSEEGKGEEKEEESAESATETENGADAEKETAEDATQEAAKDESAAEEAKDENTTEAKDKEATEKEKETASAA